MVAKRVEEELERRREEIEAEVMRRVEQAKAELEAEMMQELQRQKAAQLEEERKREVDNSSSSHFLLNSLLQSEEDNCIIDIDYRDHVLFRLSQSGFTFSYDRFFALLHDSHKL